MIGMRGREAKLSTAVAQAVASGTALVNSLDSQVLMTFAEASFVAGSLPARDMLQGEINEAFARHRDDIGLFRVVLFGRTGAGKSSLVEALTGGDGRSISTGESDFTTQPRSVGRGPLELVDTPGIGGWGRTGSREKLESIAAGAVARADLVLLCFDDQNQQASEFDMVHREIERYGRPCIAVLNVRNPRWRESGAVGHMLKIEKQVAGHAAHLRRELDLLGLSQTPIVAINTQRGVAGRATDQYAGPDADQVRRRRSSYGIPLLEDLSNLSRLEALLAYCLSEGAPRLRAKAIEQDILSRVSIGAAGLEDRATEIEISICDSARVLVAGLAIIGSGDQDVARPGRWAY